MKPMVAVSDLDKTFVLHGQGGIQIRALHQASLDAFAGECVILRGPSGSGKSTFLRCLYGTCRPDNGRIGIRDNDAVVELVGASPREILHLRGRTIGYVSQFLRTIPRVSALDIVAEPLRAEGMPIAVARERAATLLARLRIPERLWPLAPATFSGGEQQRVNIARGFARAWPILLLDEPTASLDSTNREIVVALVDEAKRAGAAIIGVFHDESIGATIADRFVDMPERGLA